MKKHPEYMILIAVLGAIVAAIIACAVSCSMVVGAVESAQDQGAPGYNSIIEEIEGHDGNNDDGDRDDADDDADDDGDDGDSFTGPNDSYTENDVPAAMEIETPELTDDLQACINSELKLFAIDASTITVTDLTKDQVATPELKNGRVLSQVSGKATITTAEGKSETIDYTSYYYAEDPTATKITWYIYAYDLGSYDLFPEGFENASGNPLFIRDLIQGDASALSSLLGSDGTHQSTNA